MKHFFRLVRPLALLLLGLTSLGALGQTTITPGAGQTADTYIRPYAEPFQFGTNIGYYGLAWEDATLAGIAQQVGSHSLRPTLPEWFVEAYGYNIRASTFDAYVNKLGMKEITCFVDKPLNDHRDWTIYPGCTQPSEIFAHLYEPIWNPDGTVNPNNYYANYIYKLLLTYGDKVRFWEVMNEPDFANGANTSAWLTRAPTPAEQLNTKAPFYHYVRMLRITYEVVKKYRPTDYVTTGLGMPDYLDALLRYSDNPDGGAVTAQYPAAGGAYFDVLSFHAYPNYALHYWDNSIGGFRYTRTSDYAANRVIGYKDEMAAVLAKYGYDGTKHPAKLFTLTESNVSRRTSDDRISSDEAQRNFGIKILVLTQKHDIKQFYYYSLGETVDAPPVGTAVSGGDEIGLMGLYENLNRDAPGAQKTTQLGKAFATTSQLLYGYQYDAARSAELALTGNVDGAAFSKNGVYIYVLWAKALVDTSEQASATYSFPAAWNLSTVQRYEWDYSVSGAKTTPAAQNVALTATPAFFMAGASLPPPTACTATGALLREQWDNLNGSTVSSIPVGAAPTSSGPLTQFEASVGSFNYGARLRGYLCVPQTGAYTFSITGDDESELWLSTDELPATKVRIAYCASWTSGARDYTRNASQQSAPVTLTAGRRYYIEALHKQNWGPGYVSVAWRLPDGTSEAPIGGNRLSPFVPATVLPPPPPPTPTSCAATGTFLREQWNNVGGNAVTAIPVTTAPGSSGALTALEAPSGQGNNYGARLRGYVCPPQSGAYTFSIVGDDEVELWLSTDELPLNKVRIASCASWTSGPRDFYRYASQQSAALNLVAGKRYYLEALHKQGWGNDYVAVAWRLPDGTFEAPIPGARLSPFVPTTTATTAVAATGTTSALKASSATAAAKSAQSATALLAYPNPFSRQATVEFQAVAAGPVRLALYDVRGQLVRQLFSGVSAAGAVQRFPLDGQGLSQGVYVLRLVTDREVLTQKLVLDK